MVKSLLWGVVGRDHPFDKRPGDVATLGGAFVARNRQEGVVFDLRGVAHDIVIRNYDELVAALLVLECEWGGRQRLPSVEGLSGMDMQLPLAVAAWNSVGVHDDVRQRRLWAHL